jgi:hypothetical protein
LPAGPERNKASPDSAAAPKPAPWKASQNDSVLNLPVAARAILIATSMASDPPVVNSTLGSLDRCDLGELAGKRGLPYRLRSGAWCERQRIHLRCDGGLSGGGWPYPM